MSEEFKCRHGVSCCREFFKVINDRIEILKIGVKENGDANEQNFNRANKAESELSSLRQENAKLSIELKDWKDRAYEVAQLRVDETRALESQVQFLTDMLKRAAKDYRGLGEKLTEAGLIKSAEEAIDTSKFLDLALSKPRTK